MSGNKSRSTNTIRRGKKNADTDFKKELLLKDDDGQEYAIVTKILGGCRFSLACFDGKSRIGKVPGRMKGGRGGGFIKMEDVLLIGLRGFQDSMCDIIHKYAPQDVRRLKMQGELPSSFSVDEKGLLKTGDDASSTGADADDSDDEEKKTGFSFDFESI